MYPDEGASQETLLEAGPSRRVRLPEFRNVEPRESTAESIGGKNSQEWTLYNEEVVKPRPLNLSDKYEIFGGVPAFVWRRSKRHGTFIRRHAISSDGSCIAVQKESHKIRVYDMQENFSLVAEWKTDRLHRVDTFTFHGNHNNELVVVFEDSTVALMDVLVESKDAIEVFGTRRKHVGTMQIKKECLVLDSCKDLQQICTDIANEGLETWVLVWDVSIRYVITLLSITQGTFRRLQIKASGSIVPTLSYCSVIQKALVLVTTRIGSYKPFRTRIYYDIDVEKEIIEDAPNTIENGHSFGFSKCGKYVLIYRCEEIERDTIEVYETEGLKRSQYPIAKKSLGQDVVIMRGLFLTKGKAALKLYNGDFQKSGGPIVAFLGVYSKVLRLTIWDPLNNEVLREVDLDTREIKSTNYINIEFCISPNVKWVAMSQHQEHTIDLFSVLTGCRVWSARMMIDSLSIGATVPIKFDVSNTKLITSTYETLYVFCPPCLIDDYELEFQCCTYNLGQAFEEQMISLKLQHQLLIPKHMMKKLLFTQLGSTSYSNKEVVDISSSARTSRVGLLYNENGVLNLLLGYLEMFFALSFQDYIRSEWSRSKLPRGMVEMTLDFPLLQEFQHFPKLLAWTFLYSDETNAEDLIVVFMAQGELHGVFVNSASIQNQEKLMFPAKSCFTIKQSEDGNRVFCLYSLGVMVIDLNKRMVLDNIIYRIEISTWLFPYITNRGEDCFNVVNNGSTIIIGRNMKDKRLIALTSKMNEEDFKIMFEEENNIVPTWSRGNGSKRIAFLEFDKDSQRVSSICMFSIERNETKKISREQLNLQTIKVIDSMTQDTLQQHALHFDERNGHLWIIALKKTEDSSCLAFAPINPHSLEDCIPCLCPNSLGTQDIARLDKLALRFGASLFNIWYNGKDNLELAFNHFNSAMLSRFFDLSLKYEAFSLNALAQGFKRQICDESLRKAIMKKNKKVVAVLLDLLEEKRLPFESRAFVYKVGFEGLWMDYRGMFENMMRNNKLEEKICEIKAPSDIFTKEAFIEAQLGTINEIPIQWKENSDQSTATSHWESFNQDQLKNIKRRGGNETTTARVTFFLIANVCKIGLNGIVRFLLMQEAPPSIFKTSLMKWVITYKWEKIWKMRSFRSLMFYVLFMVLYSIYSLWIAFARKSLYNNTLQIVFLTILLLILMLFALTFLHQEYIQMNTYIKDGKVLFPENSRWGLRKYLSSIWNLAEVLSYIMIIIVIPILHFTNLVGVNAISVLFSCIALESILIWIKVWYFAQAFKKTGAFVLMIENVIKDCMPFLCLTLVILFGFSFALFVLFQEALHEKKSESDGDKNETIHTIEQSFGDPLKTIVTMFYAMIGTFETKIYYDSESFSPIITILFIVYLATQTIVMLNMLIAIMGDTFERVKSTEEEQLLMGRARFIDACEAQLKQEDIIALEAFIGKYLYVLFPDDESITNETKIWQGRVKSIEDKLGKMITDFEKRVITKMEENTYKMTKIEKDISEILYLKENIGEIVKLKEETSDVEEIKKDIVQIKMGMEQIKLDINKLHQVAGDMEQMKDVLLLLKDKILNVE